MLIKKNIIKIIISIMLILFLAFSLLACGKEDENKVPKSLSARYTEEKINSSFTLRVNINDLTKDLNTRAVFDGCFNIIFSSGFYECTLESLNVDLESLEAKIEYSSKNTYTSEKDLVNISPYSSFVGVTFKVALDSTGKITAISGYDKVKDNLKDKLSQYGDNVLAQAEYASSEYLDESVLKMILSFMIGLLPDQELSKQDAWTYTNKISAPYTLISEANNKIIETEKGKYSIESVGSLKTSVDEQVSSTEYALSGSFEAKINLSSGEILRTGAYSENVTGYCYYKLNNEDIKDTIAITRNLTFTVRTG